MSTHRQDWQPVQIYPTAALGLRRIGSGSLWDSGRRMFLSSPQGSTRMWMGQFDPNNRLHNIPVKTILSRWILALKPDYYNVDMFKNQIQRSGYEGIVSPPNSMALWTDDSLKLLDEVQKAPTKEEIADLSMIDGFFLPPTSDMLVDKATPSYVYPSHGTGMMKDAFCAPPSGVQRDETRPAYFRRMINNIDPSRQFRNRQWGDDSTAKSPIPDSEKDPFFCPPVTVHYSRNLSGANTGGSGYFGSLPAKFQINPDDTWGALKPKVQNALATLDQQAAAAAGAQPPAAGTDQQKAQAKVAADVGIKTPTSTGTYIAAGGIAAGVIAAVVALVR